MSLYELPKKTIHISVMLDEVVKVAGSEKELLVLDCTLGGGGHTKAILDRYEKSRVVAIDRDKRAINRANKYLQNYIKNDRLVIKHGNFSSIVRLAESHKFDVVLADLGLSTDQLKEGRGFSFKDNNSLDMRMNEDDNEATAFELINNLSAFELEKVLRKGGVRKGVKKIVREVLKNRPVKSAKSFAEIIYNSTPASIINSSKTHPATVVFQAVRIWVNKEFKEIQKLLDSVPTLINRNSGKCIVISFHSLEDKMVARAMRKWQLQDMPPPSLPGNFEVKKPIGKLVTAKAMVPTLKEIEQNPASRSARMRVFKFSNFEDK